MRFKQAMLTRASNTALGAQGVVSYHQILLASMGIRTPTIIVLCLFR